MMQQTHIIIGLASEKSTLMKNIFSLFLLVLLPYLAVSQVKTVEIDGKETSMQISENSGIQFSAHFSISAIVFEKSNTPLGVFTSVSIPGFTKRYDDGRPAIPVFSNLIEIPEGAEASITVQSYSVKEISLNDLGFNERVVPSQPSFSKSTDPATIEWLYDEAYYQLNRYSEHELIVIEQGGDMRGVHFGNIVIDPIRYNPVTNMLEVYSDIVFTVTFSNSDFTAYQREKQRLYSPFYEGFYTTLPNYVPAGFKDAITEYPVKYVIVADRMFESTLQPFIEWKTEKGFTVIEAYTDMPSVGTTTTSIKTYLQNLYNAGTSGDPAPTYILFVGDVAQIPAFNSQSSGTHVTDLYYACYGGSSDNIPDVYYGRFSAQNVSQLTPQIDKTLMYEKYEIPNPSYLDTVVMVAGVDGSYADVWANGQINYGVDNYFNATNGIYSHTYLYPASDQSGASAAIRANIGAGVGYANYTAHCSSSGWADPSFSTSDIANLNNAGQYGLIVGNCCQSVKFEESSSFGEAILRAANEGAVGYIGASDYSYWDEDYYWGVGNTSNIVENPTYAGTGLGSYDCYFHTHGESATDWFISNGQMIVAGNLAVQASTSTLKKYYWEEYHLMGDPSVMNYFSVPEVLSIAYNDPIAPGSTSLSVITEDYTLVAVSLNGVLLDAEFTGASTSVTLNFSALNVGDSVLVVATKHNRIPHIQKVPVECDAPATAFSSDIAGATVTFTNNSSGGGTYQWSFGDGGSSTDVNPVHSYTASGSYHVALVQTNTCGTDSSTADIVISISAIDESEIVFTMFPNPSAGLVHFETNHVCSAIEITDVKGSVLLSQTINSHAFSIDLSALNEGLYFVRVTTAGGIITRTLHIE